ncbi:MAG: C-GCAxxG-C-C family protein [Bacteroidia bacterium]|nr:C-GCAxxG-C-C family protein [Bacteroidia bacterium]
METPQSKPQDTKQVFRQCGACSHTFAHILNREFGHPDELAELALNPLAGGIMNQGHQCGMIWGAALAVGAESYRKHKDIDMATAVAVTATQHLVDSFENRSNTVNCKEILGYSISNVFGIVRLMLTTTIKGMENSKCMNLAEDWAPEAIQSGKDGLKEQIELTQKPVSCASEVVKRMGGSEEEQMMVSGFAGGLGLSGQACGALSAAIWMKTLNWCRKNPGKLPPYIKNKVTEKVLNTFKEINNNEMLCQMITGQHFETINDHSEFINNGGCEDLIEALAGT